MPLFIAKQSARQFAARHHAASRHDRMRTPGIAFLTLLLCCITSLSVALAQSTDSDGDGTTNGQELLDGTDVNDPDSFIEREGTNYCIDWNGYLNDAAQVFELRNAGCSTLDLAVKLRDSEGTLQSTFSTSLSPSHQADYSLNALPGFEAFRYGTVCAQITHGDPGTLSAQAALYAVTPTSFKFAAALASSPSRSGSQYLGFNTYFPAARFEDLTNAVAEYAQIASDESTEESGSLIAYDAAGTEIRRTGVTVPPFGRRDLAAHVPGQLGYGSLEWRPDNSSKKFRIGATRYYYGGPSFASPLSALSFFSARKGSGARVSAPFKTTSSFAIVELENTLGSEVTALADVRDASGALPSSQPGTIHITAKGTYHLILNDYLPSGLGQVTIDPDTVGSLVATLIEYQFDATKRLSGVTAVPLKSGFGSNQRTSYNSYLGGCTLRITNFTGAQTQTALTMTRSNGASVPLASPLTIAAHGSAEVNICANENQLAYGELSLTPGANESVTAYLVRSNSNDSSRLVSSMTEQSICAAPISVTPATLALLAGSGTPGTFTVSNNSTAVTATNIVAQLPASWTDVTQNASNCTSVAPGASCQLTLTPGVTPRALSTISIQGDNSLQVNPSVAVVVPISVTGSPLSLGRNGPTRSLTITNNSSVATARNISSQLSGTALSGNVTESGNTCATLVPFASCTLNFTPGSSVVPPTSFTIQGSNTTALTASIEVIPASTLTGATPTVGSTLGGTTVTLTGTNLTGATDVTFNGVSAPSFNVISSTTISAVTPIGVAGTVDIAVAAPAGAPSIVNGFTYISPPSVVGITPSVGDISGGTSVTLSGADFDSATDVSIGGSAASFTVNSSTSITATTPAHALGSVDVTVTSPYGNGTLIGGYTYVVLPNLTTVTPNSGSTLGGTGVTLVGTGLTGTTGVTFNGIAATSVNVINSTTVTADTPANSAGAVDVTLTTPSGSSTLINGYTYVAAAVGQSTLGGTVACMNGGLQNLIAATADNSTGIEWGGLGVQTSATSVTDGATNTALIVTTLGGGTPYAAQLCSNFEVDSQGNTPCQAGNTCYTDWYLPAKNQLDCLYTNRAAIGGFAANVYWSSSEDTVAATLAANAQSFSNGLQSQSLKSITSRVRCVRSY